MNNNFMEMLKTAKGNPVLYFKIKCPTCGHEEVYHSGNIMGIPAGADLIAVDQYVPTFLWTDREQWRCVNCGECV